MKKKMNELLIKATGFILGILLGSILIMNICTHERKVKVIDGVFSITNNIIEKVKNDI